MKEKVEELKKEILKKIEEAKNLKEVNELKVLYLGKKGPLNELTLHLKEWPVEEKKEIGKLLNDLKNEITTKMEEKINYFASKEMEEKLKKEQIDITLPGTKIPVGAPNILEKIIEEVESVFMSMGYDVVDGPEIEEDKYN